MDVDCIVIVSGGLDSVTLLYYLVKKGGRHPSVITFNYGQKHNREISCAEYHAKQLAITRHRIIDLASLRDVLSRSALTDSNISIPTIDAVQGDSQPSTYVPNRNMLFLSIAVAYAETLQVDTVFYGAQRQDMYGYWDTTVDFLNKLNKVYALNRKNPVQISAPFVEHSKADILRVGLDLDVDYSQTWSCYQGDKVACGVCPTCAERLAAFKELGLCDPIPYL